MKKLRTLCAVSPLLLVSTLAGCGSGSGGEGGSSVTYGALAGDWRATALTGGGNDIPCPVRVAAGGTIGTANSLPQFACGDADTITFRPDGTFTAFKALSVPVTTRDTFTGRWAQFQTRVLLSVDGTTDGAPGTDFPYSTEFFFRNENQFTALVSGLPTINRYVFTRQR